MAERTRVAEIEFPDGGIMHAEVRLLDTGGDAGAFDRFRLDEAGGAIARIGRWVVDELQAALPERPSRVGVEFGIKIAVKSGKLTSVLAEAAGEASLVVKLDWDNAAPLPTTTGVVPRSAA